MGHDDVYDHAPTMSVFQLSWQDEVTLEFKALEPIPLKGVMLKPSGTAMLKFGTFQNVPMKNRIALEAGDALGRHDFGHPLVDRLEGLVGEIVRQTIETAATKIKFQRNYWQAMQDRALDLMADYEESKALIRSLQGRDAQIRSDMATRTLQKLDGLDQCLLLHECPFELGHGYVVMTGDDIVPRQDGPHYRADGALTRLLHLRYRDAEDTARKSGGSIARAVVENGEIKPIATEPTAAPSP